MKNLSTIRALKGANTSELLWNPSEGGWHPSEGGVDVLTCKWNPSEGEWHPSEGGTLYLSITCNGIPHEHL